MTSRPPLEIQSIEILERPAEELVIRTVFDGSGSIISQLSDEEYLEQIEDVSGKTFFQLKAVAKCQEIDAEGKIILVDKAIGFQSATVEREMRGGAVAEMFAAFGSSVFTQFFK